MVVLDPPTRKALSQEFDTPRTTVAARLAVSRRTRAIELLCDFITMSDAALRRKGNGVGEVKAIFDSAMADLGWLSDAARHEVTYALARRMFAHCDCDSLNGANSLTSHMSDILPKVGPAFARRRRRHRK